KKIVFGKRVWQTNRFKTRTVTEIGIKLSDFV
ncbi:hypothetical protein FHX84_005695, partial [Clostridium beijerinckii]|nr:hypothetical protein [Clostridium beijerinckii]